MGQRFEGAKALGRATAFRRAGGGTLFGPFQPFFPSRERECTVGAGAAHGGGDELLGVGEEPPEARVLRVQGCVPRGD